MTETLVLLDNTVLSNFAIVQQPGLVIRTCPGRACTTEPAHAEYLAASAEEHFEPAAWRDLPIIALTDDEQAAARTLPSGLGPASGLALLSLSPGAVF